LRSSCRADAGERERSVESTWLRRSSFSSDGGATTIGARPPARKATAPWAGARSLKPNVSARKSRAKRRVASSEGFVSLRNASTWDWPTRKAVEISSRMVRPLRIP
jgi:hypothetical protein